MQIIIIKLNIIIVVEKKFLKIYNNYEKVTIVTVADCRLNSSLPQVDFFCELVNCKLRNL